MGIQKKERVLLGLSGGIDSTYAARILSDGGYDVAGAVLKMHEYTDIAAAQASAAELGIPLFVIDCSDAFQRTVVENFLDEYMAARTPNPCIICNREVKFRALVDFADKNGFDKIATGHYARVVKLGEGDGTRYALARADDLAKDQTYMLWRLAQDELSRLVLPLSSMKKSDIRLLAKEAGLSAAEKKDSQEICFIPDGDYASFTENRRGRSKDGFFVDRDGRTLGRHGGIIRYTVGQRKGLGIALGARAFVTDINPENGNVTLELEPKTSKAVRISDMVFSGMERPAVRTSVSVVAKLRYHTKPAAAQAVIEPDGTAVLHFSEPQKSVAPGQSAVLYDGDIMLAGGFIDA